MEAASRSVHPPSWVTDLKREFKVLVWPLFKEALEVLIVCGSKGWGELDEDGAEVILEHAHACQELCGELLRVYQVVVMCNALVEFWTKGKVFGELLFP